MVSWWPKEEECLGRWREHGKGRGDSPGGGQELQAVSQADAHTMIGNLADGGVGNLDAFRRGPEPHNPLNLLGIIWSGWDDEQTGQEIGGDSMGRGNIVGTTNGRNAAI